MNIGELYPVILTFVLIGILLGVGILVLDKFAISSSVTTEAATSINETRAAVSDFSGWMGIFVVIIAAAVILGLVMKSFRS